ncbi:DUF11 domain-containing protein [Deinococcus sedimenti]|uniref:DUF11 domain-containing protein n=1 Tax=Deinococcus sedimenti TaxID=1867090 RepID=A0ABQ2S7R7_9DEIO|nr:DUF11 domain-containing protein [Deinococcus sedimenti]GGR99559.1 hypothetical protein GCM10008960_27800 [Deinococcus sedimenti]
MRNPPLLKLLTSLALALTPALSGAAQAAGTPAGTVIQNQATLEFTPPGEPPVRVPTPPVTTTVQAVCSVSALPNGSVAQPGQSAALLPGETTLLRYVLTNTGNAANTVNLSVPTDVVSQFTPGDLSLHRDANGNGQIDPDEPALTSLTLDADASAALLVRATTQASDRGSAYPNLIARCGTNAQGLSGETDDNNVARINVGDPPTLTLDKTFTPAALRPGDVTTVTLTARNAGNGASRAVTITDLLDTPELRDFVFVSGSARLSGSAAPTATTEYRAGAGQPWQASEPSPVSGVRARVDSLAPGATLTLTFALRTPDGVTGSRRNVAQLRSGDVTVDAPADVTLRYQPLIALGPLGNPQAQPGGELSADDRQVKPNALLNTEVCFPHTAQNLGDRPDTLTITGRIEIGEGTLRFTERDGTPITEPFRVPDLAPQGTRDFNACYVPTRANVSSATEALRAVLTAQSSRGAANNLTVDILTAVAPLTLNPVKSGTLSGLVEPGQVLTYHLKLTNTQSFALTNVEIRDNLRAIQILDASGTLTRTELLEFISADQGGTLEGETVVWRLARLDPGQSLDLTLNARVPQDTPDGARVLNTFTVGSSELPDPVPSNPVVNGVFRSSNLTMVKTSSPAVVAYGQTITYTFTVTNRSATGTLDTVTVQDTLPAGLTYVDGSSRLNGSEITPTVTGRTYVWEIPGLAPGASAVVTFDAVVTPEAGTQIRNSAIATAVSNNGETKTPPSTAANTIDPLIFGRNTADLVGYVFQDVNRNGIYDRAVDVPVMNARVILAGGRVALTDTQGRYHFRNLFEGEAALRLDPGSVAYQPLNVPQDAGRPGSRLVYVRSLTSVDFPLAPDAGEIAVTRDTTLRVTSALPLSAAQTLTVRKQVFEQEAGVYLVQLTLGASADLSGVDLNDPLPQGATLLDGQNALTFTTLPAGERVLTYRFRWTGDLKGAVTDPAAHWRY